MSNLAAVTIPTWRQARLLFQHGNMLGYYSNMATGSVTIPTSVSIKHGLQTGYKTQTQVYDSTMIKCFETSTVERLLRRIRTTCPAVYLYDIHVMQPWQNEEQKVDKQGKKRHNTRMAVLLSFISSWKRKEKKKEKNIYYDTGYSYLVTHPSTIAA